MEVDLTFFEVITSTIIKNSLAERFLQAVRELKSSDRAKHDLLLVSCYLYACRIPISVDIATAYSRIYELSAVEVANLLEGMGSVLSAYEGTLADTGQAYYVPRSRQVSEVVIWKIAQSDLRAMLDVFHAEVSPTKIGRYDVFRRGAYDAKLISRAYPEWEEGLDFYNRAFLRDSSHSLKQQGALYLASKHNYEMAFTWIDEARGMTSRNNSAIRNSYAVILFSANYGKASTSEVKDSLDESMSILSRCYDEDHRKVYHAKIFADQALKYANKFPDSPNSKSYLESTEQWLSAELRTCIGDKRMTQLRRQVITALRAL